MSDNILDIAKALTSGDRDSDYGPPPEHFARTVAAINAIFAAKLREPLTVEDWPIIMILDKLARNAHKPKDDNLIDVAGYARTWQLCREAENG